MINRIIRCKIIFDICDRAHIHIIRSFDVSCGNNVENLFRLVISELNKIVLCELIRLKIVDMYKLGSYTSSIALLQFKF